MIYPTSFSPIAQGAEAQNQVPSAQLRSVLFAQMTLNNLSDTLLQHAPDVRGMCKMVLKYNGGQTEATAYLDEKRGQVFIHATKTSAPGFKPYWSGPLPLSLSPKQRQHLSAAFQLRLGEVNLSETMLKDAPTGYKKMVPVALPKTGSGTKQIAYYDAENARFYMRVHPGDENPAKPYWSGPVSISVPSIPKESPQQV